jgi:excisionase family DNA binding protein
MSMSTALGHNETPQVSSGRRGEGSPLARRTYTIDEVAELLGLSRNRAFAAAREGRLPVRVIRVGRRMFVSRQALDRFLETGEAG